jgi:hypothetical protein
MNVKKHTKEFINKWSFKYLLYTRVSSPRPELDKFIWLKSKHVSAEDQNKTIMTQIDRNVTQNVIQTFCKAISYKWVGKWCDREHLSGSDIWKED